MDGKAGAALIESGVERIEFLAGDDGPGPLALARLGHLVQPNLYGRVNDGQAEALPE